MAKIQLPHISRLFSAYNPMTLVKVMIWSAMTALFIINIFIYSQNDASIKTVLQALSNTGNIQLQLDLASKYEMSGQKSLAALLQNSYASSKEPSSVLGTNTDSLAYWEHIIQTKPDYRDAYLVASVIALREGKTEKTAEYIRNVERIDPNNQSLPVLKKILEKVVNQL